MADASHLERMGRELKCPICLSLLNSAVSLTCNHVFCNSCIEKSMKAASSCPVCKVPYRRREIRPAPLMDNLVSVYKSMEVESGINIFVTQTAASTKQSGEDNQTGANTHEAQHNNQTKVEALDSKNQKQHQRKGSKRASATAQRSSGSSLAKPSFPTKKRVQVPQYTASGTEIEHNKLGARNGEIVRNESKNGPALQKDMPTTCAQGESIFSPFFWLREEEDLEKLSQQTDGNQPMYTPPEVPCFSDMKDSDDEAHCQMTPEGGTHILSDNADFIDSEMFDWTQRPCSPELCSSPLTKQIEHTAEGNGAPKQKEEHTGATGITSKSNKREHKDKRKTNKTSDNSRMGTSNMEVCKGKELRKNKRTKRATCEVTAVDTVGNAVHQDVQEGNTDSESNLKGKSRKSKTLLPDASVEEKVVQTISDGTEPLANSNGTIFSHVSALEDHGKSSEGRRELKKSGKNNKSAKKTLAQPQKSGNKVKTHEPATGKGCSLKKQPAEGVISQSHSNLSLLGNDKNVSDRCIKRTINENHKKVSNAPKKVKFSIEGISKDKNDGILLDADEDAMRSIYGIQGGRDQLEMETPAKKDKLVSSLNGCVLLKCNTSFGPSHCAFCQSSKVSEASGVMVHYLNGKLVADDHNAIKNAIHVHKNCAEWAPNVYFKDDNAVNLEIELSRSRRIRCCCCGVKGAALGCYEKSCRKSFHVTCARLTPECRWDYDNFVMLCPLHTSSQLPNEMPQSESRQKRKSSAERNPRKTCIHEDQVKTTDERIARPDLQWESKKKLKNLVLCCSALTNTEKEIVTEFETVTGVTILKKWEPTATHVIASIDENGACRRTLKFLMGILEGKWILSVQWIKACIEAKELVGEHQYEILVDIHGIRDGPKLGRLRLLHKQPKLFDGYTFYFMGDFTLSYKGYLHDLVIAAGGKVLNRKPVADDQATPLNRCSKTTLVIYSTELPEGCRPSNGSAVLKQRRAQAESLARSAGAQVASNSWIMNSVAGHKLQKYE